MCLSLDQLSKRYFIKPWIRVGIHKEGRRFTNQPQSTFFTGTWIPVGMNHNLNFEIPSLWLPPSSFSYHCGGSPSLSGGSVSPPFPWPGGTKSSFAAGLWNPSLSPSLYPQAPLRYGRALDSTQAKPDLKKQPDSQWLWGLRKRPVADRIPRNGGENKGGPVPG